VRPWGTPPWKEKRAQVHPYMLNVAAAPSADGLWIAQPANRGGESDVDVGAGSFPLRRALAADAGGSSAGSESPAFHLRTVEDSACQETQVEYMNALRIVRGKVHKDAPRCAALNPTLSEGRSSAPSAKVALTSRNVNPIVNRFGGIPSEGVSFDPEDGERTPPTPSSAITRLNSNGADDMLVPPPPTAPPPPSVHLDSKGHRVVRLVDHTAHVVPRQPKVTVIDATGPPFEGNGLKASTQRAQLRAAAPGATIRASTPRRASCKWLLEQEQRVDFGSIFSSLLPGNRAKLGDMPVASRDAQSSTVSRLGATPRRSSCAWLMEQERTACLEQEAEGNDAPAPASPGAMPIPEPNKSRTGPSTYCPYAQAQTPAANRYGGFAAGTNGDGGDVLTIPCVTSAMERARRLRV